MKIKLLTLACLGLITLSHADDVSYTTFNKSKKNFIKHWKISDDEFQRYEKFMEVEGRYRYPNLTPLEVLGISADSDEQVQYYAKKAAINEREAVKKQMKFILLTTEYKRQLAEEEHKNDPEYQRMKAEWEKWQDKVNGKDTPRVPSTPKVKDLLKPSATQPAAKPSDKTEGK